MQLSSTSNAAANGTGASETADDDLPSVMTCANYLKLPPYSTKVTRVSLFLSLWFLCLVGWGEPEQEFVPETGNHVQETALRHQRRAGVVRPILGISLSVVAAARNHQPSLFFVHFISEDSDFAL